MCMCTLHSNQDLPIRAKVTFTFPLLQVLQLLLLMALFHMHRQSKGAPHSADSCFHHWPAHRHSFSTVKYKERSLKPIKLAVLWGNNYILNQFLSSMNPALPGKHSWGKPRRSMSFGTVISSVSGAFRSILRLLTFSTFGLSFFFRKDRRLLLFKLLPAFITWVSSLLINGGTNTESTSGSRGGRLSGFLWVPY